MNSILLHTINYFLKCTKMIKVKLNELNLILILVLIIIIKIIINYKLLF